MAAPQASAAAAARDATPSPPPLTCARPRRRRQVPALPQASSAAASSSSSGSSPRRRFVGKTTPRPSSSSDLAPSQELAARSGPPPRSLSVVPPVIGDQSSSRPPRQVHRRLNLTASPSPLPWPLLRLHRASEGSARVDCAASMPGPPRRPSPASAQQRQGRARPAGPLHRLGLAHGEHPAAQIRPIDVFPRFCEFSYLSRVCCFTENPLMFMYVITN